jgi:hypothetical protein
MFDSIPHELRAYRSWVVWKIVITDSGEPTKVPFNPITFAPASSTDPSTWVSFDEAVNAYMAGGWAGIGFVLSDADPFTFVDLDDPYAVKRDGTPKHQDPVKLTAIQAEVYQRFQGTYAELSPSGKGLHIISLGISPSGRRRHAVEMYSSARFMTMTGNVYQQAPILDRQASIKWLYDEMGGAPVVQQFTGEYVDAETDDEVIAKVLNAANGDKVRDLVSGNWQHHYGSWSEADFALIDIIAYYTKSRFQIVRLFRQSALGQREKANRDKYILDMVDRAFDRMPSPLDIDAMRNAIEAEFASKVSGGGSTIPASAPESQPPTMSPYRAGGSGDHPQPFQADAQPIASAPRGDNPYLRPVPGLLGQIAYYIYDQAPRPVPEIALAGAIGLMAGICGRAYNVSGTGVNTYVLLLAGTGRGKEAIQSGISKLMSGVADINMGGCPAANEFTGPGDIASGQALIRHFDKVSKSFVSVVGEVDSMLKNLTARNANAGLVKLRSVLLDVYNKSGRGNVLQGTIYSDRDKNAAPIISPAFSMIGEGTPQRFYNLLDEAMVTDGLLPRFTVIEYDGDRVQLNEARIGVQPSIDLIKSVARLCGQALMLNQQNRPIDVEYTPEGKAMLNSFEKTTTGIINQAHNQLIEELWNRAHMKALKLAALVAIGCNPLKPTIDSDMADYAISCVRWDIEKLVAKFKAGDIGEGISKQMADMRKAVKSMLNVNEERARKLSMSWEMVRDKLISRRGLQMQVANLASYKNAREGTARAFETVIRELTEQGVIAVIGTTDLQKRYNVQAGRFYVLLQPNWLEQ